MRMNGVTTVLLAGALAVGVAQPARAAERINDAFVVSSNAFLSHHPDLRWRVEGMRAHARGDFGAALAYFRRAARYADKPSQAMLAEMLWDGQGASPDRATAYAWMDLAAERGYVAFATRREFFWSRMAADEKARALAEGAAIYEEFGDDVAKPRLERVISRAARNVTGSRVGSVGNLQVYLPGPGGWEAVSGDQFYDERFWKPEKYWEWQDRTWRPVRTGRGIGGDLRSIDSSPAPQSEGADGDRDGDE